MNKLWWHSRFWKDSDFLFPKTWIQEVLEGFVSLPGGALRVLRAFPVFVLWVGVLNRFNGFTLLYLGPPPWPGILWNTGCCISRGPTWLNKDWKNKGFAYRRFCFCSTDLPKRTYKAGTPWFNVTVHWLIYFGINSRMVPSSVSSS